MKHGLIIFSLLFSAALHAATANAESVTENSNAATGNIEAGKEIFAGRCANACHQAPERGRLKPKQWRVVLNTMQTRMTSAGQSPLTDEQLAQVLAYLSQPE